MCTLLFFSPVNAVSEDPRRVCGRNLLLREHFNPSALAPSGNGRELKKNRALRLKILLSVSYYGLKQFSFHCLL